MVNLHPDIEKVLYTKEDIQAAVTRLAQQLTIDYRGKNPLVVGVLKGAILFMADIIREIDTNIEIDFLDVSSYGNEMISSGEVKILKDLDTSVAHRDIIFVEDIVDSGRTLKYLMELFKTREANSVRICTLLDKPEGRVLPIESDYVGFSVPNEFVVGYGLDYAEAYRNLPYIGILKPAIYQEK